MAYLDIRAGDATAMNEWWYFLLGVIASPFLRLLGLAINRAIIDHRKKRILKLVAIKFPDNEDITFLSLDATDKRAMAKLERELREHYEIPAGEDNRRDRR